MLWLVLGKGLHGNCKMTKDVLLYVSLLKTIKYIHWFSSQQAKNTAIFLDVFQFPYKPL